MKVKIYGFILKIQDFQKLDMFAIKQELLVPAARELQFSRKSKAIEPAGCSRTCCLALAEGSTRSYASNQSARCLNCGLPQIFKLF